MDTNAVLTITQCDNCWNNHGHGLHRSGGHDEAINFIFVVVGNQQFNSNFRYFD